jgi:hypothetical protein
MEQEYRKMLASDPDTEVRTSAILCLVRLATGNSPTTSNELVRKVAVRDDLCRMCARIARDSANARNMRAVAYGGLLDLKGLDMPINMTRALLNPNVDLDTIIDWRWVDSVIPKT